MSARVDPPSHRERQGRALRNRNRPRKKIPVRPPYASLSGFGRVAAAYTGKDGAVEDRPAKRRRLLLGLLVFLQLVLLAVILAVTHAPAPQVEPLPDREQLELRYRIAGLEDIVEPVYYGDTAVLHEPVAPDGSTFLCWLDSDGKEETRTSFPVYRDTVYTARLVPAFETEKHIPYLTTDMDAVLDVDGAVTVREFVSILYLLLDTEETGTGRFVDVPEDDSCFEAAAYLKDIGILTGSRLHPDSALSCGELIETLCRFFPVYTPSSEEEFFFQDLDPESPYYESFCTAAAYGWVPSGLLVRTGATSDVSRGRFARIMNHVLRRDALRHLGQEEVGTILDVPPSGDYYDDVVEAVIPHEYRMDGGEEIWTSSKALPVHKPGFFFAGVRLHYIDENGVPAVNGTVGGLDYNRNGEVTSGDAEMDRELIRILEETVNPRTMDRMEMLRAVYDYVVDNFSYRYGSMYAFGAEGWAVKEAKRMLENGGGNCYCYAALFYELARFVGYDAKIYSGRAYGEQYEYRTYDNDLVFCPMGYTPHGWVEIEFGGEDYIFDPEYEYRSWGLKDMFMASDTARKQYGYTRAE